MTIHKDEKSMHNSNHIGDVSKNIAKFRSEGISHDQAVAKALSMDEQSRSKKK